MQDVTYTCAWLPGINEDELTEWRELRYEPSPSSRRLDQKSKAGPTDGTVAGAVVVRYPALTPEIIRRVASHIKAQREAHLKNKPVAEIVDVFARAAEMWLDPEYGPRKEAIERLPLITGYSPEMVRAAIDIEQNNSKRDSLERTLISEFKDPGVLDGFIRDEQLGGWRRAYGPELTAVIFSGNIPALPYLSILRATLLKSACFGKAASGEPLFPILYIKTILDLDPVLANCIAITYWPGGSDDIERALFSEAHAAILYGGEDSLAALRPKLKPHTRVVEHGHKVGFGYISSARLTVNDAGSLARCVAFDATMFDQQACIAPHIYFVQEGGEVTPAAFAEMVASGMAGLAQELPRGTITVDEASTVNRMRKSALYSELTGEGIEVFAPHRSAAWTVLFESDGDFKLSPLNRFLRIVSVKGMEHLKDILQPAKTYLQNAALAVSIEEHPEALSMLGEMGVARICAPGKMACPSMMWRHDGRACLAELVRWCDMEMV